MIRKLQKFPKAWAKFDQYLEKFDIEQKTYGFYVMPEQIEIHDHLNCLGVFSMPEQFLTGCLMEFMEIENVYYEAYMMMRALVGSEIGTHTELCFTVAQYGFEILETTVYNKKE